MSKFCENCGKELNINADFCTECGVACKNQTSQVNKECPKCGSTNTTVQVVNESKLVTKHHGVIWWLLVGWWWILIKWLFLTVPALFAAIFIGKRNKIKNITKKKVVCQNCGNTWDIK